MIGVSVTALMARMRSGMRRGGVQLTPTAATPGRPASQAAHSAMGVPSLMWATPPAASAGNSLSSLSPASRARITSDGVITPGR